MSPSSPSLICHWTARITAAIVSCGILAIMLSEVTGPPGPPGFSPSRLEDSLLAVILLSAMALVAGWRHEVLGGTLAAAGGMVLLIFSLSSDTALQALWPLALAFLIPGSLFLISALRPRIPH